MQHLRLLILFIAIIPSILCKIHFLSLTDDSRRNILLSKFGFNLNGTFDFVLSNFTVPDAVIPLNDDKDKNGVFGFTLSRTNVLAEGIRSKPHVCQLLQHDQQLDAMFFIFDFSQDQLAVLRSGSLRTLQLCHSAAECPISDEEHNTDKLVTDNTENVGLFSKLFGRNSKGEKIPYVNMIPLEAKNGQYSMELGIRFHEGHEGFYHFLYHNCFNYRAQGYSDRVAVDFSVSIVERNEDSYLSAGDIFKPKLYIYSAFFFSLAAIFWMNILCKSDNKNIYRVHKLMTVLVVLKVLSLFFHGMNYFFVSYYGHQREIWAITFYVVHLLKGALLFGTIILIGTGYTFFKNFLTDRDRSLFIIILPLQVVDNIAMVIIEESEFGEHRYSFWFEIFVFLDLLCCMTILVPIIWSMRHLQEGARTDGKAAFNLQKLMLFRHFYLIVISYIYLTRISKFIVQYLLPFNYEWVSEAIVELSTLFFFCMVGSKFRPLKGNPYLKLSQDPDDADAENPAVALTTNGVYENVSRIQRSNLINELNEIPGAIGEHEDSDEDDDNETLLPKAKKSNTHTVL